MEVAVRLRAADAVQERPPARGAYFLANDVVFDLAVAFLNSFREHNPDTPLCMVPFDSSSRAVRSLAAEYGFDVYHDEETLHGCDEIGARFHGRPRGHYRKLAMWSGGFEEFVYIDVDTVVLRSLDPVFGLLWSFDVVAASASAKKLEKWVWRPSARTAGFLTDAQRAYSANTGFLASRRGVLTMANAAQAAERAPALAPHMALECHEQPLLNYLIVRSGARYTSLAALVGGGYPRSLPIEHWAGRRGGHIRGGQLTSPAGRPPALFVHWAGMWQPPRWESWCRPLARLWRRGRRAGYGVRLGLRYGRLWRHYRELRARRPE